MQIFLDQARRCRPHAFSPRRHAFSPADRGVESYVTSLRKSAPLLALWPVFHAPRWSFDTQSVLVYFLPKMGLRKSRYLKFCRARPQCVVSHTLILMYSWPYSKATARRSRTNVVDVELNPTVFRFPTSLFTFEIVFNTRNVKLHFHFTCSGPHLQQDS